MREEIQTIQKEIQSAIDSASSTSELDGIKINALGKKGRLTQVLKSVGNLPADERPIMGQLANITKNDLLQLLETKQASLKGKELEHTLLNQSIDPTLPGRMVTPGKLHPLDQIISELTDIFARLGFSVEEGPNIENDYYNFEALNIPADHPARDMHDTFYLKDDHLLRTHTSPVQIRTLEKQSPPVKIIVPGKVYRCDADISHSPVFHQIEALYVDRKVTFSELKWTLEFFLKELFGTDKKVQFRPSFFPFTEPSAEVDIACVICNGKGCSVCKQSGWLEVLGCGMVNRNVFRHVNIDPDQYTGYAFGLGVERMAMLKYAITDIRMFFENDIRFLSQF